MAWQIIDGEMVLLDVDGKQLIGVNDVGARIWELMDGVRTIADIAHTLTEEFDAPLETSMADVRAFLGELVALGAVAL